MIKCGENKLSQRDFAVLRVTEYFAKSLKMIRNDTVEYNYYYYY